MAGIVQFVGADVADQEMEPPEKAHDKYLDSIVCYPTFGCINKLEKLCLKKILDDFRRHVIKFHMLTNSRSFIPQKADIHTSRVDRLANICLRRGLQLGIVPDKDISNYMKFMFLYHDNIRYFFDTCFIRHELSEVVEFRMWLSLVYNSFTQRVHTPYWGTTLITNELVLNIIYNCQNAKVLKINMPVPSDTRPASRLIRSLKHVNNLKLSCPLDDPHLAKALFSSVARLQVLNLECSQGVDDDFIFTLCCQKRHDRTQCLYNCDCPDNSLQLRKINLYQTRVGHNGISCLLIHIQTLKKITPVSANRFIVSEVISEIVTLRHKNGMQSITFQIEELFINSRKQMKCLESCLSLRTLCVRITDINHIDELLVRNDLSYVTDLILECFNAESLCTEMMKSFWEKKGPHLKTLVISSVGEGERLTLRFNVLLNILQNCLGLKTLKLERVTFPIKSSHSNSLIKYNLELFNLQSLYLDIGGGAHRANSMARCIICLAPNIRKLTLEFPVITEVFTAFLTKESFPHLKYVDFKDNPDANFRVFLRLCDRIGRLLVF